MTLDTLKFRLLANRDRWPEIQLATKLSARTIERAAKGDAVPHQSTFAALWNATKGWRVQPSKRVSSAPVT